MKIELTESQLRELLLSTEIGFQIRSRLAEVTSADMKPAEDAREALFLAAMHEETRDWIEETDGKFVPTREFRELVETAVREYDEGMFWAELEGRLGERDFDVYASDKEFAEAERTGRYPERVEWYYQKYRKEFDEHGIDRLEITEER